MSPLLQSELIIAALILLILLVLYFLQGKWQTLFHHLPFSLYRAIANPLLAPTERNDWENVAVFNPAAITDDEGKVHLLYRAIGGDGQSKIGHAMSEDGRHFVRTTGYPVFASLAINAIPKRDRVYSPALYGSGGSWGGCEDPRAVRIEDRVYMNYVAFEGWNSVRIALTSISVDDLKKKRWSWRNPVHISPPGEVHKNWVLFPEKINGHFAILHRLSPIIEIEYVDNLDKFQTGSFYVKSKTPWGPVQPDKSLTGRWDFNMRGAAAPPIKTDKGWLLLYHATNDGKYNLGALLLDLNDPTKILYRSPAPILEPEMHYENDWKPGVVYASGAVVLGDDLHVYYGGGDKYICAAHANLKQLIDWLITYGKI